MATMANQPISSSTRWQQVLSRDASADGEFFYAVKSTHIVCKPSCPSRRPSRENVQFFPSLEAARAAGYRPCKRCEPDRSARKTDPQARAVAAVAKYLREHADERVKLADVARATGVNRLAILRGFRRVFGVSPAEYAKAQRLERFRKNVREKTMRVTDAIYDAGFGSSSRLYENSGASLGMTPRAIQRGGAGEDIRYCTAASPLGRMLVAATRLGVCSILFGDADDEIIDELQERFPKAELIEDRGDKGWLAEAVKFIASQMSEHPLAASFPLDVRATAFQQRVWKALQAIPRGETRSYSELAKELGSPSSTRAVAGACAANPVAVIVPCHRVVGKNGSLTGYRWGLERKRRLLDAEQRDSPSRRQLQ
ncbi:bifunctional DNA-binding transcriptional regulator/O6-methylguanine-DNA methyltransferase Ada [Edaphobacter bradus]|uniref:bifunctional DNA-binding transcriptional regulator/O6-methylguanine-DNA methyltransferase Ada n=1 Tax=Edaphobacter bradus TaxID=2259016 RepID=UPI0021E0C6E8|nr:bifunctional DNA-binding transcriptional regulator/O6-methylguanine-DNA methyltransferase Ada [Edaphobacter bradus]